MKRRIVMLALIALVLVGGAFGQAKSSGKAVKIEWLQWFAGEIGRPVFDELIAGFEKENPGITVELVDVPFGKVRDIILSNHSVGVIPDVLGINFPWVDEFVDLGVLEPLDSYYKKLSGGMKTSDLVQAPLTKIGGNTYLAPLTSLPFVLFYNKDLMQSSDIKKVPETWAELREDAKKMTKSDSQVYGYSFAMSSPAPTNCPIVEVYPLLYTAGGRTIINGKSNIKSPEVKSTLEFLKGFYDDGSFAPGAFSKLSNAKLDEFATGRIGFMIMASNHIATLRKLNPNLNFGVAAVPKNTVNAYRLLGWDVGMAAKSKHKKEAWKFIEYLMRPENNVKLAKASAQLPANLKADTSYLAADPLTSTVASIVKNHKPVEELMLTPQTTASWDIFTQEMQKYLRGEQDVQKTLDTIDKGWTKLFTK